jgi:anti-sigma regulatory factor (Ser/Thr protein kinase)
MRTLSEHVLDIVQNSIKAKATLIEIIVEEDKINNLCSLIIKDDGSGMNEETLRQAADPFFTSRNTRKVGLGLALLKQNAEASGGSFKISSKFGAGTKVEAIFQLSNIDKPPLGDIWETFYLTILSYNKGELLYKHRTNKGEFSINSKELREMLGEVSIQQKEIRDGIIELIKTNLEDIEATK